MKNYIKYLLYKMGLRTTIPAALINKKSIKESLEPLVDLTQVQGLCFADELKHKPVLVRQSVRDKLIAAQRLLPPDMKMKILSAYRSLKDQTVLYESYYHQVQTNHPHLTPTDWERMTKAVYAKPSAGGGGHQTGGAIDLTLCDDHGQELDMGTSYLEMGMATPTKARCISAAAQQNRALLCHILNTEDFQNYPNEWWHFCYGDRMWATYKHKRYAIYGIPDVAEV